MLRAGVPICLQGCRRSESGGGAQGCGPAGPPPAPSGQGCRHGLRAAERLRARVG